MNNKNCDCRDFKMINGEIVCTKCKQPMKSQQKTITNKGRRFLDGNQRRK